MPVLSCWSDPARSPRCFCWGAITALFLLFFPPLASSSHAEGILDIYRLAVRNDPSYQGAQFSHEAARETLSQAWAAFQPTISAQGTQGETRQRIVSSENAVYAQGASSYPSTEYSLSLVQPLFDKASLANLSRAKAKVKGADCELEGARQDLIARVAKVYLGVLSASDKLAQVKTEEAAVEKHYELAAGKYKLGLAPKTDYLDAKARQAEVRANRVAAESALDGALQALREVAGEEVAALAALREDLPLKRPDPGDVETWIKTAVDRNPALESQRQAVETARQEQERQAAGHYPTLNLEASHNYNDTKGTLFGGGSEYETTAVLLRLKIPIYEGGIVKSRSREAFSLYQAALQEQEKQQSALQKETRAAYYGVIDAMERVIALREAVESQALVVQAKQDGYKSGLFTVVAVLDAQRDLTLVRQDYATARYDYVMNSLRLKKAAGILAQEDIATVQGWLEDKK